jgi:hypothetical protein
MLLVSVVIVPSFSTPLISKNVTNLLPRHTVLNFHPASLAFFKFQKPPMGFVNDVDNALRNIGLFMLVSLLVFRPKDCDQNIGAHVPRVFSKDPAFAKEYIKTAGGDKRYHSR